MQTIGQLEVKLEKLKQETELLEAELKKSRTDKEFLKEHYTGKYFKRQYDNTRYYFYVLDVISHNQVKVNQIHFYNDLAACTLSADLLGYRPVGNLETPITKAEFLEALKEFEAVKSKILNLK